MEANFWHTKWAKNEIGFHCEDANPLLLAHFAALALPAGSRIFLPLCGKTRDIAWLLDQGFRVAGAELSRLAVTQLFAELDAEPEITQEGALERFSAPGIDIFVGDIFALSRELLEPVAAVHDRAALVALPAAMRERYSQHLRAITTNAPQLLISYDYDQSAIAGPPFAIAPEEVEQHYARHYRISRLATEEVAGGMKGKCAASESVWLLTPR